MYEIYGSAPYHIEVATNKYMWLILQDQRKHFEVAIYNGKLYYQSSGELVHTLSDKDRWIFVMSPSYKLYIGKVFKWCSSVLIMIHHEIVIVYIYQSLCCMALLRRK